MTTKPVKNMSATVRAKLLELSRKNGEQFNFGRVRWSKSTRPSGLHR